jgi:hypothetical protein
MNLVNYFNENHQDITASNQYNEELIDLIKKKYSNNNKSSSSDLNSNASSSEESLSALVRTTASSDIMTNTNTTANLKHKYEESETENNGLDDENNHQETINDRQHNNSGMKELRKAKSSTHLLLNGNDHKGHTDDDVNFPIETLTSEN